MRKIVNRETLLINPMPPGASLHQALQHRRGVPQLPTTARVPEEARNSGSSDLIQRLKDRIASSEARFDLKHSR
jgi:hypothetical protein